MKYATLAAPVRRCVEAAGGIKPYCKAVGRTRQAIYSWKKIPADLVVKSEKVTGIPREKIRPDLYA